MLKKVIEIVSSVTKSYLSIYLMIFFLCLVPILEIFSIGLFGVLTTRLITNSYNFTLFNYTFDLENYSINFLLFAFGFLYFIKTLILIGLTAFVDYFSFRFNYLVRKEILKKILKKNYEFFITQRSADLTELINRITGIFTVNILMAILKLITHSIIFIAIILFLFHLNNKAVFIIGFLGLFFATIYIYFIKSLLDRYGKQTAEYAIKTTNKINETVSGIKEILTLGLEKMFTNKTINYSQLLSINLFKSQFLSGLPRFIFEFIIIIFLIIYIVSSKSDFEDDLVSLSMFLFASIRLLPSLNTITKSFNEYNFGKYTINRIHSNLFKNVKDKKNLYKPKIDTINNIELNNVSFKYPNQKNFIFRNLNFKIKKGQFIGIKGESGSGKSTFLNLLLTLINSQSGNILINKFKFSAKKIDHLDLSNFKNKILYASQEPLIINETIKKNIILEKKFENNLFKNVLKKAKIDFYNNRSNIKVGERGIKLSGGQRQKILIARALYHKKDLIILDETTNSLDLESENIILKNLNNIKRNKMILIVSHKKQSFNLCDKVYELKKNKLILIKK